MDHTRSSPWGRRPRTWTALASLALAAAACDRPAAPPAAAGTRTQAEAAPAGPVCAGTDVHTRHVNAGFPCTACHPVGGQFGFSTPYTFARGTTTAGGVLVRAPGATPTCTVGCHAPLGAAPHAVTWDTPGPLACTGCHDVTTLPPAHPAVLASMTRADCQLCHDVSAHTRGTVQILGHGAAWMDRASAGFHAFSADRGLSSCQACHGAALDGGAAQVGCARCHDRTAADGSPIPWATDCTMCHGGDADQSGAPPRAIWGHTDDPVRTGAHAAHVAGGPLAAPLDCATCHVKPADAFAPGHVDLVPGSAAPLASVTFSGLAVDGGLLTPTWSRADATCSATWCHGAGLSGGSNTAPSWIGGPGQAACGTCHGLPPPAPHPRADGGLVRCSACHGFTVDETGAVIPPALGGKHLSGAVEATGHPATWMDTASAGFHAYSADNGLDTCQACHGAALDGVGPRGTVPVGCGQCHDQVVGGATVPWTARCTMCHGGTDNQTGAPPRTQWGRGADPIRVGAHSRHLAGSALAAPIPCGACHAVPASPFDAGHITTSPTAAVAFSGVAARGPVPTWTRATATCTTYCHGTTLTGGTNQAPIWTGGAAQAACGTCHGLPPTSGKHWHATEDLAACWECHGRNYGNGADGKVDLGLHVDGQIYLDVNIKTWDPVTRRCTSICHGARTW